MKWYILENGFITDQANAEAEEWTENEIFYQVFYLLIDFESEALYNVQFQADGQTLTAYDGRHHVKIESPQELETYFYNVKGFSIEKLVAEYNRKFA